MMANKLWNKLDHRRLTAHCFPYFQTDFLAMGYMIRYSEMKQKDINISIDNSRFHYIIFLILTQCTWCAFRFPLSLISKTSPSDIPLEKESDSWKLICSPQLIADLICIESFDLLICDILVLVVIIIDHHTADKYIYYQVKFLFLIIHHVECSFMYVQLLLLCLIRNICLLVI